MNIEITDECVDMYSMIVVATLKQSYHLNWDPYDTPDKDIEYRKAIDTVLEYFMAHHEYNEWLANHE
jgi:hypothetical protein